MTEEVSIDENKNMVRSEEGINREHQARKASLLGAVCWIVTVGAGMYDAWGMFFLGFGVSCALTFIGYVMKLNAYSYDGLNYQEYRTWKFQQEMNKRQNKLRIANGKTSN